MPQHRKTPTFIRIKASNREVVCVNPPQLSSFRIVEKAKLKVRKDPNDKNSEVELIEADTIYLYFPSGTGLQYSVGIDIDQAQFDYICTTLLEFLYLNEAEFKAKTQSIEQGRMDEWNKISQDNSAKIDLSQEPLKEV